MKKRRVFAGVFTVTLCLLLLGSGFIWAEYNTRAALGGEKRLTPLLSVRDGIPWPEQADPSAVETAARLLPPGPRALLLLFEWECDGAARLFA